MVAYWGSMGKEGFRYFRGSEDACRLWLSYRLECCRQDGESPPKESGVLSDIQAARTRYRGKPVFLDQLESSPVCRWCLGDRWAGHRPGCPACK